MTGRADSRMSLHFSCEIFIKVLFFGLQVFFPMQQVQKVGKVARAICIMSHPIPDTHDTHSVQVILPQKQLGRKSDMYAANFLS